MLKLRRIIIRHASLSFKDRREELFEERIDHLKKMKYNSYKENLEITGEEFSEFLFETTKTSAEFLDIDEATYEASIKECMKKSDNAEEFHEDEEQVRLDVETEGQELLSRERTKELIIERIQMDFESEKKLSQMNPMSREESEQFVHYARQEVLDQIYIKHGVKFTDFNRAMKEYDFDDDEDIKA